MHPFKTALPVKDQTPAFQQYQHLFVDYLRNQQKNKVLPEPLPQQTRVYAKLLYNKIERSLRICFPITRKVLGSICWRPLVQKFIGQHRCQSPLYREIPDEFIDFLVNEKPEMKLPEYLVDLAHFEWMELVLETEKFSQIENYSPVKEKNLLSMVPVLNPNLHILHYRYPVHTIIADDPYWKNWASRHKPYPQEITILAGLRDPDYQIHCIDINLGTARLIELLQGKITGEKVLLQFAAEMDKDPEIILLIGNKILERLTEQNIIIGSTT